MGLITIACPSCKEQHECDTVAALTQEIVDLQRQLKNLAPTGKYNGQSIEQWYNVACRRLKTIIELRSEAADNDELIELLRQRLRKARDTITRLYIASGLHVPDESELDP
jgi:hypothetical protein